MVEMEILLIHGVLVVVAEQQLLAVIGVLHHQEMEVLEEQHLLQDRLSLEVAEAEAVEVVMDIHLEELEPMVVELVVQDQVQQAQPQAQLTLEEVVVEANKIVFKEVALMEDLV